MEREFPCALGGWVSRSGAMGCSAHPVPLVASG